MINPLDLPPVFPESGPYRVDQVTTAPLAMGLLFLLQVTLAALIHSWARAGSLFRVAIGCTLLAAAIFLFFLLASWGIGDVNRLSHLLVRDPFLYRLREPFWLLVGPVVRVLPYRFTSVHAAVVVGFAFSGMELARRLGMLPWAGWWALFIVCSPMLRNSLQSGITRQALATLLLLPLFLRMAGILPMAPVRVGAWTALAATVHSSFASGLAIALSPGLFRLHRLELGRWVRRVARRLRMVILRGSPRSLPVAILGLGALAVFLVAIGVTTADKLGDYLFQQSYFPRFLLSATTGRLLLSMVVVVVVACWTSRKGVKDFMGCPLSRILAFLFVSLLFLQLTVQLQWAPQLTSRFHDTVAFYLLITFLAWITRHRVVPLCTLPLLVTFMYWSLELIASSGFLPCGRNDDFLCVPDRWPWQVVYWR